MSDFRNAKLGPCLFVDPWPGMKVKVNVVQSCLILCNPVDYTVHGILKVGSLSLLQGIFPTQRLNPGLLRCRLILYQLRYEGSSPGIVVLNSVCTPTSSEECKFEDNKPHTYSLGSRSFGIHFLFSSIWFNEKLS